MEEVEEQLQVPTMEAEVEVLEEMEVLGELAIPARLIALEAAEVVDQEEMEEVEEELLLLQMGEPVAVVELLLILAEEMEVLVQQQ